MTLYLEIEHLRKDINFCLPLEIWAKSKRQMQSKTSWSCEHALKTASKKRNSKRTAEATDDLISNKIAEKKCFMTEYFREGSSETKDKELDATIPKEWYFLFI